MIKQLESSYRGERKKRGAKVRRPRTENNGYAALHCSGSNLKKKKKWKLRVEKQPVSVFVTLTTGAHMCIVCLE